MPVASLCLQGMRSRLLRVQARAKHRRAAPAMLVAETPHKFFDWGDQANLLKLFECVLPEQRGEQGGTAENNSAEMQQSAINMQQSQDRGAERGLIFANHDDRAMPTKVRYGWSIDG